MKVAYLINQYPQPSHTFIRREIASLERGGVMIHRFTLRRSRGDLVDVDDKAERERTRAILDQGAAGLLIAVVNQLMRSPTRFWTAVKLTRRFSRASTRGTIAHLAYLAEACVLRKWLDDLDVTHLHAHFGTNSTAVAAICRELGGPPFSFTTHGPEEFDQPIGLSLGEKVRRAKFAVAISAFGRSQLCRWTDPSVWSRIHVVRCGVDDAFLAEEPSTAIPEQPRFVCVGRLEPQKGQLLLLEAVAAVNRMLKDKNAPPVKVVLIGDGSLRPLLERRIAELGLRSTVQLAGWMSGPQIREQILAARAMILPSFAEGLPVVLMESLALGRPVITTWIAGVPELVTPSCGWLVAPGDVNGLASAILAACEAETTVLYKMGRTGRDRVVSGHDSRTESSRLLDLFNGVVA